MISATMEMRTMLRATELAALTTPTEFAYRISAFKVTNTDYADFPNAVSPTDTWIAIS
ncbi:MAG: hypothetical protein WBF93_18985 [Pirellulales bacterium]